MTRAASKRTPLVELDAEELEAHQHRAHAHALGLVVVRLDVLGPTPVDERVVEAMRARIRNRKKGTRSR